MADINLKRIPIIGDDLYQVGQVYDVVATPCATNLWVSVYAFWQYTPYAVWSVLKPDPFDQVTERFGRVHKRKRKHRLHVADKASGRKIDLNRPQWVVFKLGATIQRVGWYLSIIDATTDLLINWTSTTWSFSGCKTPAAPYAEGITSANPSFSTFQITCTMSTFVAVAEQFYDVGSTGVEKNLPGPWQIHFTAEIEPVPGIPSNSQITEAWIEVQPLGGPEYHIALEVEQIGPGAAFIQGFYRDWDLTAPRASIHFQFRKTAGRVRIKQASFMLYGHDGTGLDPDP